MKKPVSLWGRLRRWWQRSWSALVNSLGKLLQGMTPRQKPARNQWVTKMPAELPSEELSPIPQALVPPVELPNDRPLPTLDEHHQPHHDRPPLPKPRPAFLKGLEEIQDLDSFSTGDLLQQLPWQFTGGSTIDALDSLDSLTVPTTDTLSTEAMLEQIQWDFQGSAESALQTDAAAETSIVATMPVAADALELDESPLPSFLLGLENLPNLDRYLTQDLLRAVAWQIEEQGALVAEEEDVRLLEDLLVEFPE